MEAFSLIIHSSLSQRIFFTLKIKNNNRYFVIVKTDKIADIPITFDVIWMETFKVHARNNDAKVLFAGVGLGNPINASEPPYLNEEYLLQYDGLQLLDIELN